mmetsp:Transcript_21326/g.44491  ORF Transcript_21326/g.44491 Transcript_21326/m.44491 type:complete len:236 (+) Transcript_21326:62-769(+)
MTFLLLPVLVLLQLIVPSSPFVIIPSDVVARPFRRPSAFGSPLRSTGDAALDAGHPEEPVKEKKKRGRPRKGEEAPKKAAEKEVPWEDLTPEQQHARTLDDWYTSNCFDSDAPVNTWSLKDSVPSSTPVVRGKVVVVTCRGQPADDADFGFLDAKVKGRWPRGEVTTERRYMGGPEDQLFEVWLESYEHSLLFSRRSAAYDKDWEGGKDVKEEWEGLIARVEEEIREGREVAYEV